tara:strand:+ start:565 stop:2178 length:1614 start_codon:yes stop_codon:yes gene_type:complete
MNYFQKIIDNLHKTYLVSRTLEVKKKKQKIFISVVLKNLVALLEILIFVCLSYLVTGEITNERVNEYVSVGSISKLLPVIILLRIGINYIDHMNAELLGINTTENLRVKGGRGLFNKPNLSFSYVNYKVNTESGNIASIYKTFISIIGTSLQLGIFIITITLLNFEIAIMLGVFFIILFFPIKKILLIFKQMAEKNTQYQIEIDSNLERIISNFFLIKILKKEDSEINRYEKSLKKSVGIDKRISKFVFVRYHIFNSLVTLLIAVILVQSVFQIKLTLDILFLLIRGVQFYGQISNEYSGLLSRSHFIKNYLKEINNDTYEKKGTVTHNEELNDEIIKINDLNFRYDNSEVSIFENLNLSFQKGTHNLILGPNGSGKSTLIGLITGIYIPNSGSISVCSDRFSYVGPVPLIFNESLLNNIAYGVDSDEVNRNDYLDYLDKFKVFEKLNNDILDMQVSTRSLSSGQMQKISFIRAFLRNPEILFLDEAISNIDKESVEIITDQLEKFSGTIINITHNPEKFKNIDQIFKILNKSLIKP